MRLVKLGIANVNSTVGAVKSNTDRCIALARQMSNEAVTLAVFPEQVIGGYPSEDLVQWRAFVASQRRELARFAEALRDTATAYVLGLTVGIGGDLFNAAALVHRGKVCGFTPKEKLPTYNIFHEGRTLSRGTPQLALSSEGVFCGDAIYEFDFGIVGMEVCEDIWSPDGPMRRRCYSGAEIVCNLSASPFRSGVTSTRREMVATRAADNQVTLVYANLVGGNDGLVFDGGGYINQNGRPVLEVRRFHEGYETAVVDLDRTTRCRREASTWRGDLEGYRQQNRLVPTLRVAGPTADRGSLRYPAPERGATFFLPPAHGKGRSPREEFLDDLFEATSLAVADYYRKTGAFRRIGVAISGGRDSLLTLLVAWRAMRIVYGDLEDAAFNRTLSETLFAFTMPSRYSSEGTKGAAEAIASELGIPFANVPIDDAFARETDITQAMLASQGLAVSKLTHQNIQARLRGMRMWNWANSSGALFLQTGNMSEKAVGYTTVGGDLEGAFSVIANVPKTVVMAMLARLSQRFGFRGIDQTLATIPGPELDADQAGEAELMPFEVLDACLHLYGAEKLSVSEVEFALPSLFPERDPSQLRNWAAKFARLFTQSIFKWVQSPLTVHVGSLDLDRERALQLPVVQRTEWE